MSIRRFTKNLTLSLESFFDDIQNHEANATATIREIERGCVRVRAQRIAAERRLCALNQARQAAEGEVKSWKERTLRRRSEPEAALECVRRARLAREAMLAASEAQKTQQGLIEQLKEDERCIELKLDELKHKRASLVSREARAVAINATEGESAAELLNVFDRWQARVEERESTGTLGAPACPTATDPFERSFRTEEERAQLEQELAALLASVEEE